MATTSPPTRLRRRVGLLGASASGVAIVLGAGIYVLVGDAAGIAGNGAWIAFAIGALLAAGTGLSYAELTAALPEAGAAATYADEAFGRHTAFVTGWLDVAVNAIGAPAVALGFGHYLSALTGIDPTLAALGLIATCATVVLAGVTQTVGLGALFGAIELAGLLAVIVAGAPYIGSTDLLAIHGGAAGLLGAAALVFFAYEGFEEIATLAEEVHDPFRNIPRALLLAIAVTTTVYVLVAMVAISVVPWQDLAASGAPLAVVMERAAGPRVAQAIALIALFATSNTVLLLLATGPRAMYGMANRRLLPSWLGLVWARRRTPWVAILLLASVAGAFALTGSVAFIAEVTNFAVFTLFVVVNASLIQLRITRPDLPRPFRLRPAIGPVPLASAVGLGGAIMLAAFMDRHAIAVGAALLVIGVALSFVVVPRDHRTPSSEAR
jgi:APA family basic amino acid/polyamine antiporter